MFLPGTGFDISDSTPGPLTSKVLSVPDVKPGPANAITPSTPSAQLSGAYNVVDGVIGQLETYRNGAVKFRLNNGILLDVCESFSLALAHLIISASGEHSNTT